MSILRTDKIAGLDSVSAITGSVFFGRNGTTAVASGNWLTAYSESDFSFGTGDFTIEYWFYFTGVSGSNSGSFQISNTPGGLKNSNTAADGGLALNYENGCVKGIGNNGWFNGTNSVAVETWNHAALVRHSGTLQIFTNGVADTSASDSNNYSLTHLAIGGYYTNAYLMTGYISNFRIVKGTAVYSAAFTPPTERLTAIDGTVLLACQSPGNIFQEATGKTLDIRKVTLNDAPPMASRFTPDKGEDYGTTFADGAVLDTLSYMVPPGGTTTQSNRGRAVIGWANNPVNTGMDYFSIQSMGNSISFGTLTSGNRWGSHALSSSTRGLFVGGYINTPASTFFNTIDYVTIATTSNPTDFGDLTTASYRSGCCSSSTRGIIALGFVTPAFGKVNTIDLVTIATLGNATNFGDLFQTRANMSSLSSPTRGVFAGGETPTYVNTIDYVTIATTGDASNFGDLNYTPISSMAMASTTRGIIGGGYPSPANTNIIDFITIATTGNATDFGDLTGLYSVGSATSNSIRGVFCGGYTSPSKHNLMEFVTIATTGNASDFGDMLYSRRDFGACSDSHGGLS